jgi:uncharacterized damage-inducible protein DinB
MSIVDLLLPEFDQEVAATRRVLERVPEDKLDWRPHAKSETMAWLASHVATLPMYLWAIMTYDELDVMTPPEGVSTEMPHATSRAELLAWCDEWSAKAREALAAADDARLLAPWRFLVGGKEHFTLPRIVAARSWGFSHVIHHRAQLLVYLRMNDVPLPATYGPSADEQM